jgi:hypothetical protein
MAKHGEVLVVVMKTKIVLILLQTNTKRPNDFFAELF